MLTLPLPPQPAHINTSMVAAIRARHAGGLRRPATIAGRVSRRIIQKSSPTHIELNRNWKERGDVGIDSGTSVGGAKATAVVAR